jgi:hypothetical protein
VLARQAYLGMWQVFFTASRTADYQSPSLDRYASGSALQLLVHGFYQVPPGGDRDPGHAVAQRGRDDGEDVAGNARGQGHRLLGPAGSGTYYKSGQPAAGGATGRQTIYAQVQPFDGTWKVTYLVVEKAGSC